MKVGYISDLHTEFSIPSFKFEKDLDVLIVAGDVGQKSSKVKSIFIEILNSLPEKTVILYVLGNHEYVYQVYDDVVDSYKKELKDFKRIIVLDNESIVINGVKFIGSTLWSNFSNMNNDVVQKVAIKISDYAIKEYNDEMPFLINFDPNRMWEKFEKCYNYLINELKNSKEEKIVVITHYPPHNNSKHPLFINDISSGYYCNHLPEIFENKIDYWIHGHTHYNIEYKINDTKVLINARGRNKKEMIENNNFKIDQFFTI